MEDASSLAAQELYDIVNTVQLDMRYFIDGMHTEMEERKRAEMTAYSANEAKSQFLANMSHELRTPLNSLIGFSNVLLKNKDQNLNDRQINYLTRMLANGKNLLLLVNDILDLSKIEAGKSIVLHEEFILSELIQSIIEQFEPLAQSKGLALNYLPQPDIKIFSDAQKIKQILTNLISNALKFTDKGKVDIQVDVQPKKLCIHIIDTGQGIPEDKLDAIFEAFTQVNEQYNREHQGTGLGLKISQSFAHLLGGQIEVTSQLEEGSRFTLSIPLD